MPRPELSGPTGPADPSGPADPTGSSDLYANPLAYPGTPIDRSGVLTPDGFRPATPDQFAAVLARADAAALPERTAMLAIGSNGSPVQLQRKLGTHAIVPMARVMVRGLVPGVSAHVGRAGYLPATPVEVPGATARLTIIWLDDRQLAAMDETEPNYDRITAHYPVEPTVGADRPYEVYVSRHGWLVRRTGEPRRLNSQSALIRQLLRESTALAALAGPTPETFVATMRSATARERARRSFLAEGLVHPAGR